MIGHLSVQNLALVERASVEFGPGFITVTGETGAGKSIFLGALKLLAGERAGKGLIRDGADSCEVEASIELDHPASVDRLLESLDLPPCEEGSLLLWRRISASGAGRAQINGRTTTLANLQRLGERWIDFHGPDAPQHLLKPAWQLDLLDRFGKLTPEHATYREAYQAWRSCIAEIETLQQSEQLTPEAAAFLQQEIEALESLDLSDNAIQALEADFKRLESARELREGCNALSDSLLGDDGLTEQLARLLHQAREMAQLDPEADTLAERLESASIELGDLAESFAERAHAADFDEEAAADLRTQMERWLDARRKYGPEPIMVANRLDEMRSRLANQGNLAERLESLHAQADQSKEAATQLAKQLTRKRRQAARKLSQAIATRLAPLGFGKATLEIAIEATALSPVGDSSCNIRFSPNPGSAPQPLERIASSGELARVMLAIKAALAEADATPVMVFDEVDANVGGEIARAVAGELHALAAKHQVFCITHLPQVAARGDHHFVVRKAQKRKATEVSIHKLAITSDARLEELARMLGDRDSDTARSHAASLMAGASAAESGQ